MKDNKKIILIIFLISIFFICCNKDDAPDFLKSTGSIRKVNMVINGDFKSICLNNTINLIITQDTMNRVDVETGENLLPKIKTELINGVLTISDGNTFNWVRDLDDQINVYLRIKQIDTLKYTGSGNINSTNAITGYSFAFITNNGTGDVDITLNTHESHFSLQLGVQNVNVKGMSGVNYIYNIGENIFHGEQLETGYTYIDNFSSGDCYIFATKEIGAKIGYVGDIYYKGNPYKIDFIKNGKGNLIKE
ncbi:MAG: DUF2807 domain-containing protein [Bacteroidota bacterium]|nr:DUF2807 domain-containing protein [Bacteroidota bacterium]